MTHEVDKSSDPLRLVRDESIEPICPHCEEKIEAVSYRRLYGGMWGKRYVYVCQSCHRVLAISHRKGFWMG